MRLNTVICGDALTEMKRMPNNYFSCCITSPPYWALRDYKTPPLVWDGRVDCEHSWQDEIIQKHRGTKAGRNAGTGTHKKGVQDTHINNGRFCSKCNAWCGSLGLEPTFDLYVKHLLDIFTEVKRVLRKDGICFVDISDTYAGSNRGIGSDHGKAVFTDADIPKTNWKNITLKEKTLCMIPERFAIGMIESGWIMRNKIIWHKPNPMPSSARDRFTNDFEYVYFFTKSKKYFFEPIYEPYDYDGRTDTTVKATDKYPEGRTPKGEIMPQQNKRGNMERWPCPMGKNKRTTWTISIEAFTEKHYASYPEKLVEPLIECGCPAAICKKCGRPRRKIYQTETIKRKRKNDRTEPCADRGSSPNSYGGKQVIDYKLSDCGCNAGWRPGIALDPFTGSGTTLQVAAEKGRDYVGIELSKTYTKYAKKKILKGETGVSYKELSQGQLPLIFEKEQGNGK